jgi:hypothetical protein
MSEDTPTTEEVRDCWAWNGTYTGFDVWFASVKADAWDECLDEIAANYLNLEQARSGNPYRGVDDE